MIRRVLGFAVGAAVCAAAVYAYRMGWWTDIADTVLRWTGARQ